MADRESCSEVQNVQRLLRQCASTLLSAVSRVGHSNPSSNHVGQGSGRENVSGGPPNAVERLTFELARDQRP